MHKPRKITRIYTRHYTDNDQSKAYVDWSNGSQTAGEVEDYHGVLIPVGTHMGALFDHGLREGLTIGREVW
jgi:hypothetical protein